ncbi:MAG TPA: peptide deformylase [Candidatus Baltobacteraceae bacterium]
MPYVREIVVDGHPTLRKVAKKVHAQELRDPLMQQLIDDMFETMYDAPGIGLAAPQVNVSKRIFTIDLHDDDPTHGPFVVVNPKFERTEGEEWRRDGCLSVPGYVGESPRFTHVAVTGWDRFGEKIRLEGDGLFAHCLQHEIDHLNGVLYLDKARNLRTLAEEEAEDAAREEREHPVEEAASAS